MVEESIAPALRAELGALTLEQRAAALHVGDVVIKAGPGSGKTRTIVARVGYLLDTRPNPFRGVAAITYTRPAARELRVRLERLGVNPGRFLVSSTVHAFCLQHVLRPYSAVAGIAPIVRGSVLSAGDATAIWQEVFDEEGIPDRPRKHSISLQVIRRALAGGEPTDRHDDRLVQAAQRYENTLEERGKIDFEAMVSRALQVIRSSERARESLVARFPHIVVDEYQDLGPVLHQIVLEMRQAGASITAVGDEDQTIFSFIGSDPKFLRSLDHDHGFHEVRLGTNFRSGSAIIDASSQALGEPRQHRSVDGASPGLVQRRHVTGTYVDHARVVVEAVHTSVAGGVSAHEIAVLYPRAGTLLTTLAAELNAAGIEVRFEKDTRLPTGPLSDLVQLCAVRLLATTATPVLLEPSEAPRQAELHTVWEGLRSQSGKLALDHLTARTTLYRITDGYGYVSPDDPVKPWFDTLESALDLQAIAEQASDRSVAETLAAFHHRSSEMQLRDLVVNAPVPGKIVLTTYHQAKGREFDVVILPGLVEREVPMWNWDRQPTESQVAAARRELYVAMSRPRHHLVLITGSTYTDYSGVNKRSRPSRFLDDLRLD